MDEFLSRNVAVVGSRSFQNYNQIDKTLSHHIRPGDILVSGGAKGVDSMAQRWAKENGYTIIVVYPDYKHYGQGAAFVRNKVIVEKSDTVLAFYAIGSWQKGGTYNTVTKAHESGKPVKEFLEEVNV